MKRSDAKIFTTHVGSLPFPTPDSGLAVGDASHLAADVAAVVARQRAAGIDIVNEGEYAKGGDWLRYMQNRFGGFDRDRRTGRQAADRARQGPRGVQRVLPLRQRARHVVLCAGLRRSRRSARCRVAPGRSPTRARPRSNGDRCHHRGRRHRRRVPHFDRTGEPRSLSAQSILQERRRLRVCAGRSDARRIRGDRRRGPYSAGRRRLAAGAVGPHRHRHGACRRSAPAARCGSRRSITRCATSPKIASAIICAGAAGTARTPTISNWNISSI